jgi:23S rRNA G2445 N2-methylase RlmL
MIDFQERHFLDVEFDLNSYCVTNPPYGVRLGQESEELVEDLVSAFVRYSLSGGFLLLR